MPVRQVDGRLLGSADAAGRSVIGRLRAGYRSLVERDVATRECME